MRKFYFLVLFSFIFYNLFSNVVKIEKIALVNLDKILSKILTEKSVAYKDFNKEKDLLQNELDKKKDAIKLFEQSNIAEQDPLKKEENIKKINELKIDYTNYYKKRQTELEDKKKIIISKILEEIYNIIKKISETEGYTVVINNNSDLVLYYTLENDITDKIIEILFKTNN